MGKLGPWPICGNGMGRPGDDMELMWDLILAKCKLWKIYGKKVDAIHCMGELWQHNSP